MYQFEINKKFWKFGGALVTIRDHNDNIIAKARQKTFKIREKIEVFSDEAETQLLFTLSSKKIIDFNTCLYFELPTGEVLGSIKRNGLRSAFKLDSWKLFDHSENQIAVIEEDSLALAMVRRYLFNLLPQTFHIRDNNNVQLGEIKQKFNFFTYNASATFSEPLVTSIGTVGLIGIALSLVILEGKQR